MLNVVNKYQDADQKSKNLLSKISEVQNSYSDLQDLERKFKSALERYNTLKRSLFNNTGEFIDKNNSISKDSVIGKNVFVDKIVKNPKSEYVGMYKTTNSNKLQNLDGKKSYMDCQMAAISNGSKYFTLTSVDESMGKSQCSITNDKHNITIGGLPVEKCVKDSKDGNMYSNGMSSYALYSADGKLTNYIGCYNDDSKNHAMSDINSLNVGENDDKETSFGGESTFNVNNYQQAFVAGDAISGPWSLKNFIDATAKWVWYTPNAGDKAPYNVGSPMTLFNSFTYNGKEFRDVEVRGHADNSSVIYLNGKKLGENDDWWTEFNYKAKIQPGLNIVAASVVNEGGPGGLILTIKEANSNLIFANTDAKWRFTQLKPQQLIPMRQDFSAETCGSMAKEKGFKYFSLQGGKSGNSLCYVSNDVNSAKKYGSADLLYVGKDGEKYGRQGVNATYEVKTLGDRTKLGKLAWVDNDETLSEYPTSSYKIINNSPKILVDNKSNNKNVIGIDSLEWNKLIKKKSKNYPNVTDKTNCSLVRKLAPIQLKLKRITAELQNMSKEILKKIRDLEKLDVDTIQQMGVNKNVLDEMLSKYSSYNAEFSQYVEDDNYTYESIVDDSKIVVAQKNYTYLLWSGVAIVTLIIMLVLIKRNKS
jgi:hypothetical protein